ncbi:tetratricopeptide repeat protein [Lentzea sp. CA-135723]|uniref:tetratricopeptide repeat protein n=1 Tax=Lentzea sp. CA-135723 TaxID=3239950 RepID=UPI003D94D3EF
MFGLVVDDSGFELVLGDERVGPRRALGEADFDFLKRIGDRYVRAGSADELVKIGRELFAWLDGEQGQLRVWLQRAVAPVVLEVRGPQWPSGSVWQLLRAPFELLAWPDGGFLAEDGITRFGVARRLGTAAASAELGGYRLGVAFMASSPTGQYELDFEAEEMAILDAVGDARIDLLVEDTGDPEQLGERLSTARLPVVHLSCHGSNNWPGEDGGPGKPVLLMEDDTGGARPTTASELVALLPHDTTRLVFVSACLTATGADSAPHLPSGAGRKAGPGPGGDKELLAHSLSTSLVAAGVPAVIGWDGSVQDQAATLFARRLYQELNRQVDVAVAVGDARRALLASDDPRVRADWHLARVWLGPTGGGPVVAGSQKRSLVSAVHGTKRFLDHKEQVPVARAQMFVGRRKELRRALRVLRNSEKIGVLLHGLGRLGKSSLAARIADRIAGQYAVAVVFRDYSALAVLDAVRDAARTNPAARELIDSQLARVRDRPEAIGEVLVDLLAGPCAQARDGRKPLLLIIDDLERILVSSEDGPHRVAPEHAPVLSAVLRAFNTDETDSRLLLTSRYTFTLNGAETRLDPIQLGALPTVGQRKLHRRQQALATAEHRVERADLASRAVAVSRGNPGLQDLICLRLVYNEHVPLPRAEAAVTGMEEYLRQGNLPEDGEVRDFLENLALDALLEEAGAASAALVRALTLFDLPIPETVVDLVATHVGGSPARLSGLGLLEPHNDLAEPEQTAVAVSPLATGRIAPLTLVEQAALAQATVEVLLAAWTSPPRRRTPEEDLQLTRLAMLADNPAITAQCAVGAIVYLRIGLAATAASLGSEVIALLDRHHHPVSLVLLRVVADAALTSGDGATGQTLLDRAADTDTDEADDSLERARVIADQAQRLIITGDMRKAETLLNQARELFLTAGYDREAAMASGRIADIHYHRGDYDEALRIRHDVELPAFERLGDTRSIAVTWGQIADIYYHRGEYDEALRIRHEVELPAYERLGDTRSIAITWGKIGDIHYSRGDYDQALRIRHEVELPAYERLGVTREIAVTWSKIGDIHYHRGDHDEALRIRRDVTLPALERLGDTSAIAVTWGKIGDIHYRRGEYDEALRIRRDVTLPVYERLGDTRSIAITWSKIGDIAEVRGDLDEALRIRHDVELPAFERLGDTRSIAITWGLIANILFLHGDHEKATSLQLKRLEMNTRLGDLDGIAAANWDLAQIHLDQNDYVAAATRLIESYSTFLDLQRADGIAIVGQAWASLLARAGLTDQAQQVASASLQAATKIGATTVVEHLTDLLDHLSLKEEE